MRNSEGQEEKTVTRIIGDKAHSVIEKKANNQVQETEEIFHNFDEGITTSNTTHMYIIKSPKYVEKVLCF